MSSRAIRPITEADLPALVRVVKGAYPALPINADEFSARIQREMRDEPEHPHVGLFAGSELLGSMRLFHFTMNFAGHLIPCGGVGLVAVDLLHKKQRVAYDLLQYTLGAWQAKIGAAFSALYPFRPDFYRQMGFGYGTRKYRYSLKPADLPASAAPADLRQLGPADETALLACYNQFAQATHGMFLRTRADAARLLNGPSRVIGLFAQGELCAYCVMSVRTSPDQFLKYQLEVRELVYHQAEHLHALLGFLQRQADQFERVICYLHDEQFHLLVRDPRDGSDLLIPSVYHQIATVGIGMMYRITDLPALLAALPNLPAAPLDVDLELIGEDSFLRGMGGVQRATIHVAEGRIRFGASGRPLISLRTEIGHLAALLSNSVRCRDLLRRGLAEISDRAYSMEVDRLLAFDEPPVCLTAF